MHLGQDTDDYKKAGGTMHDAVGSLYVVFRPDEKTGRVVDIIRVYAVSDLMGLAAAGAGNADDQNAFQKTILAVFAGNLGTKAQQYAEGAFASHQNNKALDTLGKDVMAAIEKAVNAGIDAKSVNDKVASYVATPEINALNDAVKALEFVSRQHRTAEGNEQNYNAEHCGMIARDLRKWVNNLNLR